MAHNGLEGLAALPDEKLQEWGLHPQQLAQIERQRQAAKKVQGWDCNAEGKTIMLHEPKPKVKPTCPTCGLVTNNEHNLQLHMSGPTCRPPMEPGQLCEWGCGKEAKHKHHSGKFTCERMKGKCKPEKAGLWQCPHCDHKGPERWVNKAHLRIHDPIAVGELCDSGCGQQAVSRTTKGKLLCVTSDKRCSVSSQSAADKRAITIARKIKKIAEGNAYLAERSRLFSDLLKPDY